MAVGRISGLGSIEPSATIAPRSTILGSGSQNREDRTSAGTRMSTVVEDSLPDPVGRQAAELVLNSGPRTLPRQVTENYAKIRYDKHSHTILIQIVNAASGEVIREIPPHSWGRTQQSIPLPKGTLVEAQQ